VRSDIIEDSEHVLEPIKHYFI